MIVYYSFGNELSRWMANEIISSKEYLFCQEQFWKDEELFQKAQGKWLNFASTFLKSFCMIYMVCYISTLHLLHLFDKMAHSFMQISLVVNRVKGWNFTFGVYKEMLFSQSIFPIEKYSGYFPLKSLKYNLISRMSFSMSPVGRISFPMVMVFLE